MTPSVVLVGFAKMERIEAYGLYSAPGKLAVAVEVHPTFVVGGKRMGIRRGSADDRLSADHDRGMHQRKSDEEPAAIGTGWDHASKLEYYSADELGKGWKLVGDCRTERSDWLVWDDVIVVAVDWVDGLVGYHCRQNVEKCKVVEPQSYKVVKPRSSQRLLPPPEAVA